MSGVAPIVIMGAMLAVTLLVDVVLFWMIWMEKH